VDAQATEEDAAWLVLLWVWRQRCCSCCGFDGRRDGAAANTNVELLQVKAPRRLDVDDDALLHMH